VSVPVAEAPTFSPSRFLTVLRREVNRFWQIKRQTLLTPLLQTFLYITIFGAALGSRINQLEGQPYIVFILPGLIMMAFAMNAFGNNAASIFQQRFMHAIDDQLASPLSNLELLLAYALGGFLRGALIAVITFATASFLVHIPLVHPWLAVGGLFMVGAFFSLLGLLLGVIADSFDNLSMYENFILQPLIFLGGVFYSASLLPPIAQIATKFDPVFYMINMVRHGFLGHSDINPWISFVALTVFTVILFFVDLTIFKRGYKLRS
jgi:ABC-2 type transport system permease protein